MDTRVLVKILTYLPRKGFILLRDSLLSFTVLCYDLAAACVACMREGVPLVVEWDSSEYALAATVYQGGQLDAFNPKSKYEASNSTVNKESVDRMAAVRKWSHFLHGKHFTSITD